MTLQWLHTICISHSSAVSSADWSASLNTCQVWVTLDPTYQTVPSLSPNYPGEQIKQLLTASLTRHQDSIHWGPQIANRKLSMVNNFANFTTAPHQLCTGLTICLVPGITPSTRLQLYIHWVQWVASTKHLHCKWQMHLWQTKAAIDKADSQMPTPIGNRRHSAAIRTSQMSKP